MDKQMRRAPAELSLLKSMFKQEDDSNLISLRKYFFGKGELKEELKNDEVRNVLKKIFYPEISLDAPLGQNIDLYMTIPLDNVGEEDRILNLEIRQRLISFLRERFGIEGTKFNLDVIDLDTISVRARNTYIGHVENQLVQIKTLANMPEVGKVKTKNSSK